ncbi:phosphate propanoyltransferase [Neomoorella humiferrea]|uniref:phosphate propanoyltransferase n=1 Tax=Neomoorella humiferrea TaxID=676965 RepID=UPI003BB0B691
MITDIVKGQLQEYAGLFGDSYAEIIKEKKIPVGISNRHVHLSEEDLRTLFGPGARLTKLRDLSQPGQFAAEQTVILVGPKGVIENVRVLGPTRKKTQVEISVSDCFKLGVQAPIRDSGQLEGSARITIVGPESSVTLNEGCIIAARHIHMHPEDARRFGVKDGERVNVRTFGPRGVTFYEVLVRVHENYKLEMHIDIDEANAACLKNGDFVEIIET